MRLHILIVVLLVVASTFGPAEASVFDRFRGKNNGDGDSTDNNDHQDGGNSPTGKSSRLQPKPSMLDSMRVKISETFSRKDSSGHQEADGTLQQKSQSLTESVKEKITGAGKSQSFTESVKEKITGKSQSLTESVKGKITGRKLRFKESVKDESPGTGQSQSLKETIKEKFASKGSSDNKDGGSGDKGFTSALQRQGQEFVGSIKGYKESVSAKFTATGAGGTHDGHDHDSKPATTTASGGLFSLPSVGMGGDAKKSPSKPLMRDLGPTNDADSEPKAVPKVSVEQPNDHPKLLTGTSALKGHVKTASAASTLSQTESTSSTTSTSTTSTTSTTGSTSKTGSTKLRTDRVRKRKGYGSGNGMEVWSNEKYWVSRHLSLGKLGSCTEVIKLHWVGSDTGPSFSPKCAKHNKPRSLTHEEALLLIGQPSKDFCLFSSKEFEYFYTENGKWMKGNVVKDKVIEEEVPSDQVSALVQRVNKWKAAADKYIERKANIAEKQKQENERNRKELERLKKLENEEESKFRTQMTTLLQERLNEYVRQVKEEADNNVRLKNTGFDDVPVKQQDEIKSEAESKETAIRAKESTAQSKYQEALLKIKNTAVQENARHTQENHKHFEKFTEEHTVFLQEYQQLKSQGF